MAATAEESGLGDEALARVVVRRSGEGTSIRNPVGGSLRFNVRGAQSAGALTSLETVAAPGDGPPLHTHASEDEGLMVLEGDFRFRVGDEVHEAPVGTYVFVPRLVAHTWQNLGAEPGRILATFTPASEGMETFFERFAELASPSDEEFRALAAEAGMAVLGPPLAVSHPLSG